MGSNLTTPKIPPHKISQSPKPIINSHSTPPIPANSRTVSNHPVVHSYANRSAGLRFDNSLANISLSGGSISGNNMGIYIRKTGDVSLNNIMIFANRSHGCYL